MRTDVFDPSDSLDPTEDNAESFDELGVSVRNADELDSASVLEDDEVGVDDLDDDENEDTDDEDEDA